MVNCEILHNGALRISLEDLDATDWLNEKIDDCGPAQIWPELLESYSCNGSYAWFDASEANPFIGLTGAPCIAESLAIDDSGKRSIEGRVWFYPHYMMNDESRILLERGFVDFALVS